MPFTPTIDRRRFLRSSTLVAGGLALAPHMAFARAATERRFVFIIQRGAADGINTIIPYAEPAYTALRGPLEIDATTARRLDGTFALHPSLATVGALYDTKQALFVHAVATPYRDRSHFDGQNVLETGGARPYQRSDGWMNRLAGLLPATGGDPIAFAPTIPLALRGPAKPTSYAASNLPTATDDLLARVTQLYANDAQLHGLWRAAVDAREEAGELSGKADAASTGALAGLFLARPDGPRIAMIETGGWDTHSGQNARLATQLRNLDTLVGSLKTALGTEWNRTVVLVATEFGRTAAANGTGGTDHGTGACAMMLGGAVRGGRVLGDWPGLAAGSLYEGRDVAPTTDLELLFATLAAETFGLDVDRTVNALASQRGAKTQISGLVTSAG